MLSNLASKAHEKTNDDFDMDDLLITKVTGFSVPSKCIIKKNMMKNFLTIVSSSNAVCSIYLFIKRFNNV